MPLTNTPAASVASGSATPVAIRTLWGPLSGVNPAASYGVSILAMNDSDNSPATIFMPSKAGTINRIGVYVTAVNGSPSINVGIVTLDASGNSTTTPYGGSAVQIVTSWTTGWVWITLSTPAVIVADGSGQFPTIAARLWQNDGDPATNNISVRRSISTVAQMGLPAYQEFLTAWTKSNAFYPSIAVRYSDGVVLPIRPTSNTSITTLLGTSFNSGSAADEQGAVFTLPFDAECYGAQVVVRPAGSTSVFEIRLYDGTTLIASALVDPDNLGTFSSAVWVNVSWPDVDLTEGTTYRLVVAPTTVNGLQIPDVITPDADSQASWPEGTRWGPTSRADAGAFTDGTLAVPQMALWLSSITLP